MENTQPTYMEKGPELQEGISEDSTKSGLVAATEKEESENSLKTTTATMQSASSKIWKSAELKVLRSKIGLVAGALSDFQQAKGLVAVMSIPYDEHTSGIKIVLVAEGLNLVAVDTDDGMDFVINEKD